MRFQLFIFNIPTIALLFFVVRHLSKVDVIYHSCVLFETIDERKKTKLRAKNIKHANRHDYQDGSVKKCMQNLHSLFWMFVYYFISSFTVFFYVLLFYREFFLIIGLKLQQNQIINFMDFCVNFLLFRFIHLILFWNFDYLKRISTLLWMNIK